MLVGTVGTEEQGEVVEAPAGRISEEKRPVDSRVTGVVRVFPRL